MAADGEISTRCAHPGCRERLGPTDDAVLVVTSYHARRFCTMDCVVSGYQRIQEERAVAGDLSADLAALEATAASLRQANTNLQLRVAELETELRQWGPAPWKTTAILSKEDHP